MTVPTWIDEVQWRDLVPPAIVLSIGDKRSAERLELVPRTLCVTEAKRYAPIKNGPTWCNIFLADALKILRAPIPHWFDLSDGRGRREMRANDIVDGLRAQRFPGWSMIGSVASVSAVTTLAALGLPQIAVWRNPEPRRDAAGRLVTVGGHVVFHSGHVALVVPTPAGGSGIYVSGAGRRCVHQCRLDEAFGHVADDVEFYRYEK